MIYDSSNFARKAPRLARLLDRDRRINIALAAAYLAYAAVLVLHPSDPGLSRLEVFIVRGVCAVVFLIITLIPAKSYAHLYFDERLSHETWRYELVMMEYHFDLIRAVESIAMGTRTSSGHRADLTTQKSLSLTTRSIQLSRHIGFAQIDVVDFVATCKELLEVASQIRWLGTDGCFEHELHHRLDYLEKILESASFAARRAGRVFFFLLTFIYEKSYRPTILQSYRPTPHR